MATGIGSWYPTGVTYTITLGTHSYIGYVDDSTVLKYPQFPEASTTDDDEITKVNAKIRKQQQHGLEVEEQILEVLGSHPRIVHFKGKHNDGILLEYMPSGSVESYLHENSQSAPHDLRLRWVIQAAEAVAYIHSKDVLHCNVHPSNMLLDKELNIRLCDFQGKLLNPDGTIRLDGWAGEDATFSMPQLVTYRSSKRTDIFALGCAIYFIMQGHLPFSESDALKDEEIEQRWRSHQFPDLEELPGGNVVQKCWVGEYETASEVVQDLKKLCQP